jgi:hypothetical protein
MIKYQEGYSWRKGLYGKGASVIIADELTSVNWRYADYFVPADGSITADFIIQKAIDEISLFGGGEIKILKGDYRIFDPVKIKSSISISGEGDSTRILCGKDGTTAFLCEYLLPMVNSVSIKDMCFATDDQSKMFIISSIIIADNVNISGCKFESSMLFNLYLEKSQNVSVSNSYFVSNYQNSSSFMQFGDIKNISILNNTFIEEMGLSNSMISVANPTSNIADVSISGNYLDTKTPSMAQTNAKIQVDVNDISSVFIGDNTIVSSGLNAIAPAIAVLSGKNIEVARNTIDGGYLGGIIVKNPVQKSTNVVVDSNSIFIGGTDTDNAIVGIGIEKSNNMSITNNMVRAGTRLNPTLTQLRYGIVISSDCTSVLLSGNNLTSTYTSTSLLDLGITTATLGGNKL